MSDPALPLAVKAPAGRVWSRAGTLLFLIALFLPGVLLAHDRYWLPLFSRYMALALFALSVDLVWGYTGLMTLGQGLFFALGAYAVGYSLKLQRAALLAGKPLVASRDMALPDFMDYCRLDKVPAPIAPLIDIRLALLLAVVIPVLVGTVFGLFCFKRRIKGVFFALVTQALVLAAFTFVSNQQPYTGGVVGMTGLAKLTLLGHRFVGLSMYLLIVGVLAVCFVGCRILVASKFGRVLTAIRDNEFRVRALGYDTAMYKTFVFALAAGVAGLAGALYVAALGTTGPDSLSIGFSIEVVILVAVGGRGTLFGAVLGAVLVNLANTYINDEYKEAWPIILGALFIGVVLFLPDGIVGGLTRLARRIRTLAHRRPAGSASDRGEETEMEHTPVAGAPGSSEPAISNGTVLNPLGGP